MTAMDNLKYGLNQGMEFLFEMPPIVPITLLGGAICLHLYLPAAPPCLAFGISTIFSRLAYKIVPFSNEQLLEFHGKFGKFRYLALALAIALSILIPAIGIALALILGVCEGFVVEFELKKFLQAQRENGNVSTIIHWV